MAQNKNKTNLRGLYDCVLVGMPLCFGFSSVLLHLNLNILHFNLSQTSPYLIQKPGNFKGNDQFEGYCADLAKKIADHIKIDYRIVPVPDAKYGSQNDNGTWNGMVGTLMRHVGNTHISFSYEPVHRCNMH